MAMIYCRECGKKYSDKSKSCPKCGYTSQIAIDNQMVIYLVSAFFLGYVGIHKFYANRPGEGIAMLLMGTIGWLLIIPGVIACIWGCVDFIIGICNLNNPEKIFRK